MITDKTSEELDWFQKELPEKGPLLQESFDYLKNHMGTKLTNMNESMAPFVTPLRFEKPTDGKYRAEWTYSHVNWNRAYPNMVYEICNNLSNNPMGQQSGHMARVGLGLDLVWSKTDNVSETQI